MYVVLDDDDLDEIFDDDSNDNYYDDAYNTGVCIGAAIAGTLIALDSIFDD